MANKIIGRTDTTGNVSVVTNSDRAVLLVGTGVDETKEVLFQINSTTEASTHFGPESNASEIVRILIRNGVTNIKGICVGDIGESEEPYTQATDAYAAALTKSMSAEDIMCIILDKSDKTLYSAVKEHLAEAEAEDLYRYAVVGCGSGVSTTELAIAEATAVDSDRMFIPYPNMVNDAGTAVDGSITAAGIAAAIVTQTNDPALPVSGVPLSGYGGVAVKLLKTEFDTLCDGCVVPIYVEGGVPYIYRLVTTSQKDGGRNSIWHDATTRLIADDVLDSVMAKLRANYKRTKNVTRVLNAIKTDVISVLEDKEGLEIIQNFDRDTVSVIRDPNDIYGALVDYKFQVVTPLYTIIITQHMKV